MARTISDEDIRLNIIVNGNPAQKQLLDLEKATRAVKKETEAFKIERKKLEQQGEKGSKRWLELNNAIKKNTTILDNNKAAMKELQNQIGVTGLTMAQLKKRASLLKMQLMHTVPGGAKEKEYRAELKAIGTRLDQLSLKGAKTKMSLSNIANGFNKYAALGASVVATTTGVVIGFQKMIDYNGKLSDVQSDVQKTTGLTKKEVNELTKSFGILNTRTSRMDLLKIAEEGGRIGIAKQEIGDFVSVMNKANVALGDSFKGGPEQVASQLGKLKLLFKETKNIGVEKAYESIGSAINELGANGVATEANIASFATRVGSLPDNLKPTIQDALGLGAAFEESGIQAEVSGRAYSIFLGEAAKNTDKFAKVMGISAAQVEELINTNPTQFFLQFSSKLAETSKKGTDTAKTLQDLGLSADGVKKIVGAAGNNVDRFKDVLNLSNKSMIEATSLTNEYNIKNNNFAATLEKVKKKLLGAFSSQKIISGLSFLVTSFGKLIGAIKDVNVEFAEQSQSSFNSAVNYAKLADESQNLLNRYKDLTKDGIKPTKDEKLELDSITLQLKDRLGESVIAIDKETGSYQLNTEAVKRQIKLKRLAADEEAMTLVSRAEGAKQEISNIKSTLSALNDRYLARKREA
ncbi:phage tail tape measure protein, partial [Tenacibaculum soleae]|uniref:phage tail tape measure protein n=1 Tax=Tenacibaculum soleae TaxID=447689 RepID=UPI00230044EF